MTHQLTHTSTQINATTAARERLTDFAVVAACALVAFALRWVFATRSGMWRDECLFLYIVQFASVAKILTFLRLHESHPPLFYLLMRGWLALFGNSERAALAFPVALGSVMPVALYATGHRLFGRTVAITAAVFAALSPALADNASFVRPYALLPLLCLFSVYGLWRGLVRGGPVRWLFYVAATAALVYTHNWGWLVVGAQWLVGAGLLWLNQKRGGDWLRPAARPVWAEFALAQIALLAVYAPWLPTLLYQTRHAGHGGAKTFKLFGVLDQFATIMLPLPDYCSLPLLIGVGVWTAWGWRQYQARRAEVIRGDAAPEHRSAPRTVALILLWGVPLAAFGAALLLNKRSLLLLPRCEAMLAPCVLLAVVYALMTLPGRPVVRLVAVLTTALGFLWVAALLSTAVKSNAREVAATLSKQARPDDLIIISPEQLGTSFNYYFRGPNPQINFPEMYPVHETTFEDWPQRVGRRASLDAAYGRIAQARQEGRRVWMITMDGSFPTGLPDDDAALPPRYLQTNLVGVVRTAQILERLRATYGQGEVRFAQPNHEDSDEILAALLFAPPAP